MDLLMWIKDIWYYYTNDDKVYISSTLQLCASSPKRRRELMVWKYFFSNPLDRSRRTNEYQSHAYGVRRYLYIPTPSHLYPGLMPNLLGGGGGPLYVGRRGPLYFVFWIGIRTRKLNNGEEKNIPLRTLRPDRSTCPSLSILHSIPYHPRT